MSSLISQGFPLWDDPTDIPMIFPWFISIVGKLRSFLAPMTDNGLYHFIPIKLVFWLDGKHGIVLATFHYIPLFVVKYIYISTISRGISPIILEYYPNISTFPLHLMIFRSINAAWVSSPVPWGLGAALAAPGANACDDAQDAECPGTAEEIPRRRWSRLRWAIFQIPSGYD